MLLRHFVPDVAIIDVDGKDPNDISAFEGVRNLLTAIEPSVILTRERARYCGANGETCGASLCVDKPFQPRALVYAVSGLVKVGNDVAEETLRYGAITLNARHFRAGVKRDGARHELELRPAEFRLLRFLMTYPDRVHTRSDLLRTLWAGAEINERTVDQTVRRLRQELERFGLKHMLETLAGIGYRFRLR